jgi:hypothetical protein
LGIAPFIQPGLQKFVVAGQGLQPIPLLQFFHTLDGLLGFHQSIFTTMAFLKQLPSLLTEVLDVTQQYQLMPLNPEQAGNRNRPLKGLSFFRIQTGEFTLNRLELIVDGPNSQFDFLDRLHSLVSIAQSQLKDGGETKIPSHAAARDS